MREVFQLARMLVGLLLLSLAGKVLAGLSAEHRADIGERLAAATRTDPEFRATLEGFLR